MQCSSIVDDEHAMDWHLEAVAADLVRTTVCAEHSVALLQAITGTRPPWASVWPRSPAHTRVPTSFDRPPAASQRTTAMLP